MRILPENEHQPSEKNTITLAVLHRPDRALLLLQRNPDAYPGHIDEFPNTWELIGGSVEAGEEVQAAAHRELQEETGLELPELELVDIAPFLSRGIQANNWIYIALVEKYLPIVLSREHVGYSWQPLEEALHIQLAFKHSSILEAIVDMRSLAHHDSA